MPFNSLGLCQPILAAIAEQGFTEPYPIQLQSIPAILAKKDIQGHAHTGSGKTASFVLPILHHFQSLQPDRSKHLKVLIIVPTRELSMQISEVISSFSAKLPIAVKNLAVYGGVPINQQMVQLKNTEILVATPGRLLDLVGINAIHLGKIDTLVLDEADKMLDLGFQDEMADILRLIPIKRQTILFSATLNGKLETIHNQILKDPVVISIEEEIQIENIKQTAYIVAEDKKGPFLRHLIQSQNIEQVLVFVSSIRTADNVVTKLNKNKIQAAAFHSQKTQSARNHALAGFKNGKIRVLVATDLASRGIDIAFLPFVINYELPRSPKDYIHRIGRTGRANNAGEAISLITLAEEPHFYIIQKKMGKKVEKINTEGMEF